MAILQTSVMACFIVALATLFALETLKEIENTQCEATAQSWTAKLGSIRAALIVGFGIVFWSFMEPHTSRSLGYYTHDATSDEDDSDASNGSDAGPGGSGGDTDMSEANASATLHDADDSNIGNDDDSDDSDGSNASNHDGDDEIDGETRNSLSDDVPRRHMHPYDTQRLTGLITAWQRIDGNKSDILLCIPGPVGTASDNDLGVLDWSAVAVNMLLLTPRHTMLQLLTWVNDTIDGNLCGYLAGVITRAPIALGPVFAGAAQCRLAMDRRAETEPYQQHCLDGVSRLLEALEQPHDAANPPSAEHGADAGGCETLQTDVVFNTHATAEEWAAAGSTDMLVFGVLRSLSQYLQRRLDAGLAWRLTNDDATNLRTMCGVITYFSAELVRDKLAESAVNEVIVLLLRGHLASMSLPQPAGAHTTGTSRQQMRLRVLVPGGWSHDEDESMPVGSDDEATTGGVDGRSDGTYAHDRFWYGAHFEYAHDGCAVIEDGAETVDNEQDTGVQTDDDDLPPLIPIASHCSK
jgi:hypothetical protein